VGGDKRQRERERRRRRQRIIERRYIYRVEIKKETENTPVYTLEGRK
jgi:hypothetical protein